MVYPNFFPQASSNLEKESEDGGKRAGDAKGDTKSAGSVGGLAGGGAGGAGGGTGRSGLDGAGGSGGLLDWKDRN